MGGMRRVWLYFVVFFLVAACAPTKSQPNQSPGVLTSEQQHLADHISALTEELITETQVDAVGKLAVADLIGPNQRISGLGEYISEKLSTRLQQSRRFRMLERSQLKQILRAKKDETTGYFDQDTVQKYGGMIGVDSMVVGKVADLGSSYDVTAKIVSSSTGGILGAADVLIPKSPVTESLVGNQKTATLTINVTPAVPGSASVSEQEAVLRDGRAIFKDLPLGHHVVIVRPQGCQPVRHAVNLRQPYETLDLEVSSRLYKIRFQVVPPDATLIFDGREIEMSPEGFATIDGLPAQEYPYVVDADMHKRESGVINPLDRNVVMVELISTDPFLSAKNSFFTIAQKFKQNQNFAIRLWTDKSAYRPGEKISFHFKTERDCYLNLVDVSPNGEIRLIFPNQYQPNHLVRAGVTHSIPDPLDCYYFEVQPPRGRERVYAIASNRPLNIFDYDFNRHVFETYTRGGATKGVHVRGLEEKLKEASLSAANEYVFRIQ